MYFKVGITLFTVSHRKSLWKYHEVCGQGFFFFAIGAYNYENEEDTKSISLAESTK